jgi:hypothetical protein
MEKLLIATYSGDLPQLELCCQCLKKNWTGNKFLTVAWGKPNPAYPDLDIAQVKNLIEHILDGWIVEIVDGNIPGLPGYYEQQVNKIRFSIDKRFDDTIVFDSKDFLLKPTGIDFFKSDGLYRIAYFKNGPTFASQYQSALEVMDHVPDNLPTPFNTTPWIWSVSQLQKFWQYMQNRFGSYLDWKTFPGATEWIDFYIFNYCDKDSVMPMTDDEYEFVNFCGVWQSLTVDEIKQQAIEFQKWESIRVWKHTRKDSNIDKISLTQQILLDYGIEKSSVEHWRDSHTAQLGQIDYSAEF